MFGGGGKKKPAPATLDDLAATTGTLQGHLAGVRNELKQQVTAIEDGCRHEIQVLRGQLSKLDQSLAEAVVKAQDSAKAHTNSRFDDLQRLVSVTAAELSAQIQTSCEELKAYIGDVEVSGRQALADELEALGQHFDEELNLLSKEHLEAVKKASEEVMAALEEKSASLSDAIAAVRKELKAGDKETREAFAAEIQKSSQGQKLADKLRDERHQRSEGEVYLKIGRLEELLQELTEKEAADTTEIRTEAASALTEARTVIEERLSVLDTECSKLRSGLFEVQNVPTRRVEWVIRNATSRLRRPEPEPGLAGKFNANVSWFSPVFDAGGAHGLQLELQLFRPHDPPLPGQDVGDCSISLWACKGTNIIFRLYVGSRSQVLERKFNGRVPYSSARLGFIQNHIEQEDDCVRVGIEILEVVRELEYQLQAPKASGFDELITEMVEGGAQGGDPLDPPLPGSDIPNMLVYHMHVNHRVYDQVCDTVESFKSRLIRRVEWRVSQASHLRRCFPSGDCLCSKDFSAAGISGLQLILYPAGHQGVERGYASLFLYAPAGTTIKGWLSAGKERREISNSWEDSGAFGRTNFARLESCIDDVSDSILITFEIEDAHQDLVEMVAHPAVVAGDRRSLSAQEGAVPGPVTSTVKLMRGAGKIAPAMEEVKVLPSLWTPKNVEDFVPDAPTFQPFEKLKITASARPSTANGRTEGNGGSSQRVSSRGAEGIGARGPDAALQRPSSRGLGRPHTAGGNFSGGLRRKSESTPSIAEAMENAPERLSTLPASRCSSEVQRPHSAALPGRGRRRPWPGLVL